MDRNTLKAGNIDARWPSWLTEDGRRGYTRVSKCSFLYLANGQCDRRRRFSVEALAAIAAGTGVMARRLPRASAERRSFTLWREGLDSRSQKAYNLRSASQLRLAGCTLCERGSLCGTGVFSRS